MTTLQKTPNEDRAYRFNFGEDLSEGTHGVTFDCGELMPAGDQLAHPLTLPLIAGAQQQPAATVFVTASAGLASALTAGSPIVSWPFVYVRLSGGIAGVTYTVTVQVSPSAQGNTVQGQGRLQVVETLS